MLAGTTVWVTHRFAGFHCWDGAPASRAYLGARHRHVFHVRVEVPVSHDDRDVEYHDLLSAVRTVCSNLGPPTDDRAAVELGGRSCEMIAREIASSVKGLFATQLRQISVDVSEDGECGSTVVTTTPMRISESVLPLNDG